MMNATLQQRNVYEEFDLQTDILYFNIGVQGMVSFHGKNYHIKKRMSSEQLRELVEGSSFYQLSGTCYINLTKIKSIDSGRITFLPNAIESKQIAVGRRKQFIVERLFIQRDKSKELRNTQ